MRLTLWCNITAALRIMSAISAPSIFVIMGIFVNKLFFIPYFKKTYGAIQFCFLHRNVRTVYKLHALFWT